MTSDAIRPWWRRLNRQYIDRLEGGGAKDEKQNILATPINFDTLDAFVQSFAVHCSRSIEKSEVIQKSLILTPV